MIVAVSIVDKKLKSLEKYEIYNSKDIQGYICRGIRGDIIVTLFMDGELATHFCLKYADCIFGTCDVEYIPDIALSKEQIDAVICPFDRHGGVSITYHGVF